MITREEYLTALDIVEAYHKQLSINNIRRLRERLPDDLQRGDYVKYIGGSTSKNLTKGKTYKLIGKRIHGGKISIRNDKGGYLNITEKFFTECDINYTENE